MCEYTGKYRDWPVKRAGAAWPNAVPHRKITHQSIAARHTMTRLSVDFMFAA
jgi:hypothetical protein